jgi:sugar/nucleoside kinase (ribokinase family)
MMSVRGGDAAGQTVARAIAAAGIRDLSVTFLDRATPSYTALVDRHGDVIAALADMELYELAFAKQLRRASLRQAAARADALFVDANLPAEALARVPGLAAGKPVFALAVSPAKAGRLSGVLDDLSCLFLNTREAAILAGAPPASADPAGFVPGLRAAGLRRGVITGGAQPLAAFDEAGSFEVAPPPARQIVDATGAGDALAGALAAALLAGEPFRQAVRHGMAAALLAIESPDAAPAFTRAQFKAALARVPMLQDVACNKEPPHVA